MYTLVVKLIPVNTKSEILFDKVSTNKHFEQCKYCKDILFESGNKIYTNLPTHKDIMLLVQRTLDDIFINNEEMVVTNLKVLRINGEEESSIARLVAYATVRVGTIAFTPLSTAAKEVNAIHGDSLFKLYCEDSVACVNEFSFYDFYTNTKVD